MIAVTYPIGLTSRVNEITPSFIPRGVIIANYSADNIAFDNTVDPVVLIPPGVQAPIVINHLVSLVRVRSASNTTGYASIKVLDSEPDTRGAPNLLQLPGTITATIPSVVGVTGTVNVGTAPPVTGTVAISTLPAVQVAGGQTIDVGAITTLPPVAIAGGQSLNVGAVGTLPGVQISGGSVNVGNTTANPIPIVDPDIVATYVTPNNATATIVLARRAYRLIVQPILGALARGGLLSLNATDSTTQTYEFLENESIPLGPPFPLSPILPYQFPCALKSGATIRLTFTGSCGFLVAYQ